MKKNLFFALMLCALTSFATVRTVSNQTPNPGQFTTIQAAINASSAGDTVYVHPSQLSYSAFALDRRLTIIGSGFDPSSINLYPATVVSGGAGACTISNINASGSLITGMIFFGCKINFVVGVHDFTISRCYANTGSYWILFAANMYNITIAENFMQEAGLIYSSTVGASYNFLITNNVFRQFGGDAAFQSWIGVLNVNIVNNLFYGNGTTSIAAGNPSGLNFSNNIFNKIAFTGLSGCTFSNNLTFQCSGNTPWVNNGTDLGVPALGTQNIAATSPNFLNQANIDAGGGIANVNFFVLNAGSPTLSSMPGDPDMGPYGGNGSYNFNKASASTLPYVYSLSIGNPTIQSGTNLNINVVGKKHD